MQHAQHNRLRRAAVYVALLMLLGVISLTVTQCRIVGDNATGVRIYKSNPNSCIADCQSTFQSDHDAEQKLHQTNVENCQALSPSDRGPCLVAEDARHSARMDEIGQAKLDCINGCHQQGGN